ARDNRIYVGSLSGGGPPAFLQITNTNALGPEGLVGGKAPPLTTRVLTPDFPEEGANVSLVSSAAPSEPDNRIPCGAAAHLTSGFRSGDTLTFSNNNNITGSYNSSTGVLVFSGIDSFADYQTALQSVQYHGGENPTDFSRTDSSRTLTWVVNDGLLTSAPQTSSVSVVFVNHAPTLTNFTNANYTEEGSFRTP